MRLGVEEPLPLRSSALLPRSPTTTTYYRLAYFYSATLAWFYSALDTKFSIGDNQTLSEIVKTAASRVAMRATLVASYDLLSHVHLNVHEPGSTPPTPPQCGSASASMSPILATN